MEHIKLKVFTEMRLLSNYILAERIKPTTALTDGGIYLPPIALDDLNTGGPKHFGVLAVGPGRRNRKGRVLPLECQPGDRVICESFTKGVIELKDGTCILSDDMVLAVIPRQS